MGLGAARVSSPLRCGAVLALALPAATPAAQPEPGALALPEGGDVSADVNNPPGFLITEDSAWYGINASYHHGLRDDVQLSLRAEWLRDEKGAHALLPAGDYHGVSTSVAWWVTPGVRLRPELRFDWYDGDGSPYGGHVPTVFFGEEDRQWVFSLDVTWFYGSDRQT